MKGWELMLNNLLLLAGAGVFGVGCWQKDPAWAAIIVGAMMFGTAIWKGWPNAKPR